MIPMTIEFDRKWEDAKGEVIYASEEMKVMVLSEGTHSGRPSVMIRFDLPDGKTVVGETTARLFCSAGRMITSKYPNLFDGD